MKKGTSLPIFRAIEDRSGSSKSYVCVVKVDCLEYAISSNQDSGVWGGTTEEERKSIRREYRRTGSLLNF